MRGAFDAVSFSVGDIGSHWSNGLCCCDLVSCQFTFSCVIDGMGL